MTVPYGVDQKKQNKNSKKKKEKKKEAIQKVEGKGKGVFFTIRDAKRARVREWRP